MLDERVGRRQSGHTEAGSGPHVAVTVRAGLREHGAHDGVEFVGLSNNARRREHEARTDRRADHQRGSAAATAPGRRGRRLCGDQLHVRLQNSLLLLGPDNQIMMPAAGRRGKTRPPIIDNCNGARFRQREVIIFGVHRVEDRRKGLCRQLFWLRFERADRVDDRVLGRPRSNSIERGHREPQRLVQLSARHHNSPRPFGEQLAVPGDIRANRGIRVVAFESSRRDA
jgi:hypothetical protein